MAAVTKRPREPSAEVVPATTTPLGSRPFPSRHSAPRSTTADDGTNEPRFTHGRGVLGETSITSRSGFGRQDDRARFGASARAFSTMEPRIWVRSVTAAQSPPATALRSTRLSPRATRRGSAKHRGAYGSHRSRGSSRRSGTGRRWSSSRSVRQARSQGQARGLVGSRRRNAADIRRSSSAAEPFARRSMEANRVAQRATFEIGDKIRPQAV